MANEVNQKFAPNQGSLYSIDDELKPTKEISPVSVSNGLGWNIEDDTFYYIDSATRQVAAYDYDPNSGTICKKFFTIFVIYYLQYFLTLGVFASD